MMKKLSQIIFLILSIAAVSVASADEITDSLDEAKKLYKDGNYSEALNVLNGVTKQMTELASNSLAGFLPEAPDGFTMEEPEIQSANVGLLGLGNSVSATYRSENGTIDISITSDSPMVQMLRQYASNPAILQMSGMKLVEFDGVSAIVNFDEGSNSGSIQVVLGEQGLVAGNASGVDFESFKGLLEKVDYDELAKHMNQ